MLLYNYWGHSFGTYYETVLKDAEAAAKLFVEVGKKIEKRYPTLAMNITCAATSIMIYGGFKDKASPYFEEAIQLTLSKKKKKRLFFIQKKFRTCSTLRLFLFFEIAQYFKIQAI